jgi:hypothetical protein
MSQNDLVNIFINIKIVQIFFGFLILNVFILYQHIIKNIFTNFNEKIHTIINLYKKKYF